VIRVLIADDQALVRAGFRMILDAEEDLDVIGEAPDGLSAVDAARRLKPDVVLMDIRMPELDGIEATKRVAALGADPPVHVLVLTTFDLNEYVYEALRAGASGFLLKDAPELQLLTAIRVVADGASIFAPSVTRRLVAEFARRSPSAPPRDLLHAIDVVAAGDALLAPSITRRLIAEFAARPDPTNPPRSLAELTDREREITRLVAEGLTNNEIAGRLVISPLTAKTHVSNVLRKLGCRDRAALVALAYESGLISPG
jgi:DNA-binding NarL/FixJ family response regulator